MHSQLNCTNKCRLLSIIYFLSACSILYIPRWKRTARFLPKHGSNILTTGFSRFRPKPIGTCQKQQPNTITAFLHWIARTFLQVLARNAQFSEGFPRKFTECYSRNHCPGFVIWNIEKRRKKITDRRNTVRTGLPPHEVEKAESSSKNAEESGSKNWKSGKIRKRTFLPAFWILYSFMMQVSVWMKIILGSTSILCDFYRFKFI